MLQGLYLLSQEGQCPGHPAFRENPLAHTGESSGCCVCLLWDCYKLLQSSQWMAFLCIAVDTSISSDIRSWQWITVLTDCCLNRSYFSFSKTVWRRLSLLTGLQMGLVDFYLYDLRRMALSLTGLVPVSEC